MKDQTKALILCVLAFVLGMACLGCKMPPTTYTIQTTSPDIWAAQPKQNVTVKMEFRR